MVALGKEGDCKGMCRNKEAVVEAKENGTERGLFQKKTAITEVLIAL